MTAAVVAKRREIMMVSLLSSSFLTTNETLLCYSIRNLKPDTRHVMRDARFEIRDAMQGPLVTGHSLRRRDIPVDLLGASRPHRISTEDKSDRQRER
jgi:hypothetical protein